MNDKKLVIGAEDQILVTGASGFIGAPIVSNLLERGFVNIRCLVRESSNITRLENVIRKKCAARVEIIVGNLLSRDDCSKMARDSVLIYHLAAGTGTKAFSEAFLNSVVSTRNLLDATIENKFLRRFVNVSS